MGGTPSQQGRVRPWQWAGMKEGNNLLEAPGYPGQAEGNGRSSTSNGLRALGPCAAGLEGWTPSGFGQRGRQGCLASPLSCPGQDPSMCFTCPLRCLQSRCRPASRMVFSCPRAARRRRYHFLEAGKGVGEESKLTPDT